MDPQIPLYGLLAEFHHEEELVKAMRRTYEAGYRKIEAYTPFPVHGLTEYVGVRGRRLPWVVLGGGLLGGLGGLFLQWYSSVIAYPFNVGGKPYASWPNFIPIAFETTILLAGIAAVLGMLALNRLPEPYHPVFNVRAFARASRDRFFLCVEADDPQFDLAQTKRFLHNLGAHGVDEVPR